MPAIGQKVVFMKKSICGQFVSQSGRHIGLLVKVAKNRYVVCGVKPFASTIEWISAEFAASSFKKHSVDPVDRTTNWTAAT